MGHHSSHPDPELQRLFEKLQEEQARRKGEAIEERMGATGKFPDGKLCREDEGEIQIRVGSDGSKVLLDFGKKPIAWIGMDPQQAADIASSILEHARRAARHSGKVLRVSIGEGPSAVGGTAPTESK